MKAINIKWVTDGEDVSLPDSINISLPMTFESFDEDKVFDFLSDTTGFLHEDFELVQEYILSADKEELEELVKHLFMNGYKSKIENNLLLATENEYKEIETILEDRDIFFINREPIRQLDITTLAINCCNCCDDLTIEDGRINTTYELWLDCDQYFGWQTRDIDDVWINFYTDWHPDGSVTASYIVEGDNVHFHEEWELTANEVSFFRDKMERYCQKLYKQTLMEFWQEQNPDYGHCNTCKHYSKCNICSDCHEGSLYEYYMSLKNM